MFWITLLYNQYLLLKLLRVVSSLYRSSPKKGSIFLSKTLPTFNLSSCYFFPNSCLHLHPCFFVAFTFGNSFAGWFIFIILIQISMELEETSTFSISSSCCWINTGMMYSFRCSDHLHDFKLPLKTLIVSVIKAHACHSSVQAKEDQVWERWKSTHTNHTNAGF